jgi:hypothetical protein
MLDKLLEVWYNRSSARIGPCARRPKESVLRGKTKTAQYFCQAVFVERDYYEKQSWFVE